LLNKSAPRGDLPAEMVDSMLFGHERGAFTGAVDRHRGCMEETRQGTHFLDEVGDLAPCVAGEAAAPHRAQGLPAARLRARTPFAGRIAPRNRELEAMVAEGASARISGSASMS